LFVVTTFNSGSPQLAIPSHLSPSTALMLAVAISPHGSIALIWYHPANSAAWAAWCAVGCQIASHALTAVLWGPWQAKLSNDPLGPASSCLARILSTHWIRTLLINAYGFILLAWAIECLAP